MPKFHIIKTLQLETLLIYYFSVINFYEREENDMITFIIGLVILFGGAALYGKFCEKVFGPDDRKTPAYTKQDGVDYVPMREWKNSLINLLNIAGTGPILGPIQGILFGPIAFITIPIGNIIGGAMHDYFSGMICLRDGGSQMPETIRRYSNKGISGFLQSAAASGRRCIYLYTWRHCRYAGIRIRRICHINFYMGDLRRDLCLLSDRYCVSY